jgi:hypothetical protein
VAIHDQLLAAVDGKRGVDAADRLCEACVMLFDVDAAAISLVFDGANSGRLGSSGEPARMYDELQFIVGEGPCLDSVTGRAPVSHPAYESTRRATSKSVDERQRVRASQLA